MERGTGLLLPDPDQRPLADRRRPDAKPRLERRAGPLIKQITLKHDKNETYDQKIPDNPAAARTQLQGNGMQQRQTVRRNRNPAPPETRRRREAGCGLLPEKRGYDAPGELQRRHLLQIHRQLPDGRRHDDRSQGRPRGYQRTGQLHGAHDARLPTQEVRRTDGRGLELQLFPRHGLPGRRLWRRHRLPRETHPDVLRCAAQGRRSRAARDGGRRV